MGNGFQPGSIDPNLIHELLKVRNWNVKIEQGPFTIPVGVVKGWWDGTKWVTKSIGDLMSPNQQCCYSPDPVVEPIEESKKGEFILIRTLVPEDTTNILITLSEEHGNGHDYIWRLVKLQTAEIFPWWKYTTQLTAGYWKRNTQDNSLALSSGQVLVLYIYELH